MQNLTNIQFYLVILRLHDQALAVEFLLIIFIASSRDFTSSNPQRGTIRFWALVTMLEVVSVRALETLFKTLEVPLIKVSVVLVKVLATPFKTLDAPLIKLLTILPKIARGFPFLVL